MTTETKVGESYRAGSPEEQRTAYDDWAADYEKDLCAMGYRLPAVSAAVFTRFVPLDATPILDAGCGGGIQTEPLKQVGFGRIVGIDFSPGMLKVAKPKGLYDELHCMALGEPLDFADETFAATYSIGTVTPKHAPPSSFDELIRVTQKGGLLVFSLRSDAQQEPEYPGAVEAHTEAGHWTPVFCTESFASMPYGEPEIEHQLHVYRRL